jgi:hypothetical protein
MEVNEWSYTTTHNNMVRIHKQVADISHAVSEGMLLLIPCKPIFHML